MGEGMLVGTELQRQTLQLYGELVCRRESWAGKLVFSVGVGASGSGLAAAVSIAGGTSLVVDPNAAAVKAVFRSGGVDFVVNSLDEALRVLKNEIRKGTPLGVAVVAEVGPVVEEMRERGVVADLEWDGAVEPSARLVGWLGERGWSERVIEVGTTAELREVDARLLKVVGDGVRRNWVERIGRYQRVVGGGGRVVWLGDGEGASF
jgi:urocanate hydratase